jgi:hypothetical protein
MLYMTCRTHFTQHVHFLFFPTLIINDTRSSLWCILLCVTLSGFSPLPETRSMDLALPSWWWSLDEEEHVWAMERHQMEACSMRVAGVIHPQVQVRTRERGRFPGSPTLLIQGRRERANMRERVNSGTWDHMGRSQPLALKLNASFPESTKTSLHATIQGRLHRSCSRVWTRRGARKWQTNNMLPPMIHKLKMAGNNDRYWHVLGQTGNLKRKTWESLLDEQESSKCTWA